MEFFQAVAVTRLLNWFISWKLTKNIEKKTWCQPHTAARYLERILEEKTHNTATVRPLASHQTKHSSKMNITCGTLPEKQKRTSMDPYRWMYQYWQTRKDIYLFYVDIRYNIDDMSGAIYGRDGLRERESGNFMLPVLFDDQYNGIYVYAFMYVCRVRRSFDLFKDIYIYIYELIRESGLSYYCR